MHPPGGISSAGRALRSHRRGQGFESPILHFPPMKPVITWSAEAEQLLREVPFFVRPAVRRRIESLALEAGREDVDADFYRQARDSFGRK